MAYTKYSLTPANNNAAPPDGAPEGMLPSAVNDTMRDMMAQIRDCGDGIRGGTYTMTAPVITGGSISGSTMSSNVITGGSINNTPIGASTANTGAFTTLSASSTVSGTGFSNYFASPPALGGTAAAAVSSTNLSYTGTLIGGTGVVNLGSGQFYKDASGNVGVGTTSPSTKLDVAGNAKIGTGAAAVATLNGSSYGQVISTNGLYIDATGQYFRRGDGNVEYMRIDSSGILYVGTTTYNGISGTTLLVGGSGNRYIDVCGGSSNGNGGVILGGNASFNQSNIIWNAASNYVQLATSPAGSQVRCFAGGSGGVYLAATATAWASLSDETTKTDLKPIENAVDKVNQLRSVTGRYKTDDEGTSRSFLIAQDVQKVLPEAVNIQDKETGVLGLQYTDVIPLLVASIKELKAELDATKAEVAALRTK